MKQCTLLDCNDRKRLELLNQLEDRNVCGRVLVRIAHLYDWPEKIVYFKGAYVRLLVQVEEDSLDGEELFLIAIGIFSIRRKWTKEVERLMLLSAARGNFAYALTVLGGYYSKTERWKDAVAVYEKGCSLGYANCMYELALITPYGDPKKVELHRRVSSLGHQMSTHICQREGWLLDDVVTHHDPVIIHE